MKVRPMLFSAPMVRALLDGSKTQTRRVVKPQPESRHIEQVGSMLGFKKRNGDGFWLWPNAREKILTDCPYGQPGDRLWVRENGWERPERTPKMMREGADTWEPYYFDADGLTDQDSEDFKAWGFKRRPSIHMPRIASRITLEITGVRVERLQDISRGDAMAEGCPFPNMAKGDDPRQWYTALWDQINGAGSWKTNPWVWVVEFKKVAP